MQEVVGGIRDSTMYQLQYGVLERAVLRGNENRLDRGKSETSTAAGWHCG